MLFTVNFYWYTLFSPTLLFIFIIFLFLLNVMHKSCPAHHQKVTVPNTHPPGKNSSQQFLTFVFPFIGHILPFQ